MIDRPARPNFLFHLYMAVFLAYMFVPLIIMGGAALNDTRFPSVYPWVGFTDRWFVDLWNDGRMWISARNTILVAIAVVAISLPDRHGGRDPDQRLRSRTPLGPLRRDGRADPHARRGDRHLDAAVLEQVRRARRPASVGARPGLLHRRLRHAAGAGAAAELRPRARGGGARSRRQPCPGDAPHPPAASLSGDRRRRGRSPSSSRSRTSTSRCSPAAPPTR